MEPLDLNPTEESTQTSSESLSEQIARRAYELYEARGRLDGYDTQDWLQAEQEILGQPEQASKATAGS